MEENISRSGKLQDQLYDLSLKIVRVEENLKTIHQDILDLKKCSDEIKNSLKSEYVNKDSFGPVQRLVYGFISIVGVGLIGAWIGLLVHGNTK